MTLLGLTGGIGVGKSASDKLLRERGVAVIDTDILARDIVEPGQPALAEIRDTFGAGVIGTDGRLRRAELAQLIFQDPAAREKLEGILHPRIRALWRSQVEIWRTEGQPLAVVVIPLLFETNAQSQFDAIICVACSAGTQHLRLLDRGWTEAQIEQRLASQWPIEQKIARAHYVIWTEGSFDVHARQLELILRAL